MGLIAELKRRNVIRVGIAYGVAAWVLLQITGELAPIFEFPEWTQKFFFVVLAVGFVPALIFAWAFELTPEGIKKEKDVDRSESITNVTGRRLDFMIIGVLIFAVLFLFYDRYSGPPQPTSGPELAVEKSIAVLPFVNMSSDTEQEFFSDGITEEILNALAAVKELKVAGRTSSFAFKGQNEDLRLIGDTLGVEHILEGSVRKSGTKIRITAQLIQVEDGFHMWSDAYDRELTDVFAIQDEIANEILKQLKTQLLGEELRANEASRTDPEVYDLYLLAKQRLYDRTRQSIESAAELLSKAISLDPDYAPAHAQRGIAILLLSEDSYGTIPVAEAMKRSKRFIDNALRLDPELAEAWAGLGLYHTIGPTTDNDAAIDALTRALDLNPNLINASNWLYNAATDNGDYAVALQLIEDMNERDPLYRPGFGNAVSTYLRRGMLAKAKDLIDRYRSYDSTDPQLLRTDAMLQYYKGEMASGFLLAKQADELAPSNATVRAARLFGLSLTYQIEELAENGTRHQKVDALDMLGERDEAFRIAYELAGEDDPIHLLVLFNRYQRSSEAVDYLEERWTTLDSFAAEHRFGEFGYSIMNQVALAYYRVGNEERLADALAQVEAAHSILAEHGYDNWGLLVDEAKYLALSGRNEQAITRLEAAFELGKISLVPLATTEPVFELLGDDPRVVALESAMTEQLNAERNKLGLESIDPGTRYWQ